MPGLPDWDLPWLGRAGACLVRGFELLWEGFGLVMARGASDGRAWTPAPVLGDVDGLLTDFVGDAPFFGAVVGLVLAAGLFFTGVLPFTAGFAFFAGPLLPSPGPDWAGLFEPAPRALAAGAGFAAPPAPLRGWGPFPRAADRWLATFPVFSTMRAPCPGLDGVSVEVQPRPAPPAEPTGHTAAAYFCHLSS